MDREAWHATIDEAAKSWTWQNDWTEILIFAIPDLIMRSNNEIDQALDVGFGQGSLWCHSPWVKRVGHNWMTDSLNTVDLTYIFLKSKS